jgi:hypothetical protein
MREPVTVTSSIELSCPEAATGGLCATALAAIIEVKSAPEKAAANTRTRPTLARMGRVTVKPGITNPLISGNIIVLPRMMPWLR